MSTVMEWLAQPMSNPLNFSAVPSSRIRKHTDFGSRDDWFFYFYPDVKRNRTETRKPLFAEVDDLGYVPAKLKFFAIAQKVVNKLSEIGTCFKRPLHLRRPVGSTF